jgi:hypothetical protein
MPSDRDDTLHEVTEVAVIRHAELGVLLLHSADRRWHFPDTTVRVGEPWDESLRRAVRSATGITDLRIGPVLLLQNFGAGEVDARERRRHSTSPLDEHPAASSDLSIRKPLVVMFLS